MELARLRSHSFSVSSLDLDDRLLRLATHLEFNKKKCQSTFKQNVKMALNHRIRTISKIASDTTLSTLF
jgi:hypothetical protein